jgi:hypothetical protein
MFEHEGELAKRDIGRDEVVDLVKGATIAGKRIGFQGQGGHRTANCGL